MVGGGVWVGGGLGVGGGLFGDAVVLAVVVVRNLHIPLYIITEFGQRGRCFFLKSMCWHYFFPVFHSFHFISISKELALR